MTLPQPLKLPRPEIRIVGKLIRPGEPGYDEELALIRAREQELQRVREERARSEHAPEPKE